MKRSLALAAFALLLGGCASSGPKWTRETPEGFRFDYVVGYGEGATLPEAQAAAEADARRQVGLVNSTLTVTSDVTTSARETSAGIERSGSVDTQVRSEGMPTTIMGWERVAIREDMDRRSGAMTVRGLYRRPRASGVRNPPGKAGFVMRNVFLPGWGQRAMDRDAQATLYTTSYVASWGAFAAAAYLRNQETTKLNNAADAIEQRRALDAVNQWGNVRNWALGAAAVVWSAALVDALATQPQFLPIMTPGPTPGAWGLQWSVPR